MTIPLGATLTPDGSCTFCVWANKAQSVTLVLESPEVRRVPMQRTPDGYHTVTVEGVGVGARYRYDLDGRVQRPDPASRSQPDGVHGASAVSAPNFAWTDGAWRGLPMDDYIFYEVHVGTFTPEGTFEAVIAHLPDLVALGVTAIELMPVGQFPGVRGWGYDGVYPYAAQHSYGGLDGLRRLVDACHAHGLAVFLDVVYNHLGPEGNYLHDYADYFTDRYRTPWGSALNFDGAHSDPVRRFFIENALFWLETCHIDGLRLDATQAMADLSARTVLEQLAAAVGALRARLHRHIHLIAETDRSDSRLLRSPLLGGVGLDGQWSDEFHHTLHALLTGEEHAYYTGYRSMERLVRAMRWGFTAIGEYSPVHQRRHGTFKPDLPAHQFVVFAQNHDHAGNRVNGERLCHLISFEAAKLTAGLVVLSPYLPLLFMGEEYAEANPFLFFTNFGDPHLRQAVREGRQREAVEVHGQADGIAPDPESPETFARSRLNHASKRVGQHAQMLAFHTALIALRKGVPALRALEKDQMEVIGYAREGVLWVRRWHGESAVCIAFNVRPQAVTLDVPMPEGAWECVLRSDAPEWGGAGGAPLSVAAGQAARVTLPAESVVVWGRG